MGRGAEILGDPHTGGGGHSRCWLGQRECARSYYLGQELARGTSGDCQRLHRQWGWGVCGNGGVQGNGGVRADGVSMGMGVSVRMGVSAGPLRGSAMSKHSRSPEDVDSSSCDQLHHT